MNYLAQEFWGNTIYTYLQSAAVFFLVLVVGYALKKALERKLTRWANSTETRVDDEIVRLLARGLPPIFLCIAFYFSTDLLVLNEKAHKYVHHTLVIMLVISVSYFLAGISTLAVEVYFSYLFRKSGSKVFKLLKPLAKNVTLVSVWLISFSTILSILGYNVLSLITGMGVGGVALALASQTYLNNIFSGISIFLEKPFQIGDLIEVNGKMGYVEFIGLRYTRIRSFDDTTLILPNTDIANAMVENISARKAARVKFLLPVVYETTNEQLLRAKEAIVRATQGVEGVDGSRTSVYFYNFGDSGLELWVAFWITDTSRLFSLRDAVLHRIKENLEKEGIELAYPTQTVYLKKQA